MKTHPLALLAALALFAGQLSYAADPLQDALQKGLLEEEANQNLSAAIKAYQAVLSQFEDQRKIAATATFRLGECYRKLGRTNEAFAQYERVLKSFPEQTALVTLSQNYLAASGRSLVSGNASAALTQSGPASDPEQVKLLRQEATLLQQQMDKTQVLYQNKLANLVDVLRVNNEILGVLRKLPENAQPAQQQALIERQIQYAQQIVNEVENRSKAGLTSTTEAIAAQRDLLELQRELLAVKNSRPQFQTRLNQIVRRADLSDELAEGDANYEGDAKEIERLKEMMRNSPDLINAIIPGRDRTPFDDAASKGQLGVVRFLLDNGANVQGRGEGATTPLHYAAANGHKAVVQLLLDHGAKVDSRNAAGETPLILAAGKGYKAVAQLLLSKGADVNARTSMGITPLHYAATEGQLGMADLLLANKAELNAQDRLGFTPLMKAVIHVQSGMVDWLLNRKADPNLKATDGETALTLSIKKQNFGPMTQALLEHGADPNVSVPWTVNPGGGGSTYELAQATPLHYAVSSRNLTGVDLLLKYGAKVNSSTPSGSTLLERAVYLQDARIVKRLLDAGADPNASTAGGYTPLVLALRSLGGLANPAISSSTPETQRAILEALLAAGADPNLATSSGETPLLDVVSSIASSLVGTGLTTNVLDELIAKGANVNGKTVNGCTPLHVAAARGATGLVQHLLEKGADVNAQDDSGNTPLIYAAVNGARDTVDILLKAGAKVNLTNKLGQTALAILNSPRRVQSDSWGIPTISGPFAGGFGRPQGPGNPGSNDQAISDDLKRAQKGEEELEKQP